MFYLLLIITFLVALLSCHIVIRIFSSSINEILQLIVPNKLSKAWLKYIKFAIYVVGISGGVRIWELEKYINTSMRDKKVVTLTLEHWTLEIYRTLIGSLQSIAWMLLVVFVFSLIAYVIIRIAESRN
ncbi:hypothetical protein [Sporohalobacter salinus]|uniref:hypothetical protein n=1 Tax=Sporohalobacter salinus TaxID=1494606 RepID=UPI001961F770|nr:hypothetical protein [Sporohalobacter salinus]MBM7624483.1 hypothetical protein [Sporohalobacter salinus]